MVRYGLATMAVLILGACDAETSRAEAPLAGPIPLANALQTRVDTSAHTDFQRFFADFRTAVIDDDREAVAAMTKLPFVDYRYGDYCEPNAEDCDQPPEALTAFDKATFLAKYDRIFAPEVIAAIRDGKVREGFPEDDNVAPSVLTGEYFLELEDVTQQRVFTLEGGVYKLSRVPFYS